MWYTEPGEVPVVEAGRLGGDNRVGERIGVLKWSDLRGGTGSGAVDCVLLAGGAASGFRVFDRRGGGTLGFSLSSGSCTSFADLNEAGDDGSFRLSTELLTLRRVGVDTFTSSDGGRAWREPLDGGSRGGGVVLVFKFANCGGFCLIGGDFIGSFCGVWKYEAPSVNCDGGNSIR